MSLEISVTFHGIDGYGYFSLYAIKVCTGSIWVKNVAKLQTGLDLAIPALDSKLGRTYLHDELY